MFSISVIWGFPIFSNISKKKSVFIVLVFPLQWMHTTKRDAAGISPKISHPVIAFNRKERDKTTTTTNRLLILRVTCCNVIPVSHMKQHAIQKNKQVSRCIEMQLEIKASVDRCMRYSCVIIGEGTKRMIFIKQSCK